MDFNFEQLKAAGIDINTGLAYTGGEDKYCSALRRFFRSSQSNKEKIDTFMKEGAMEDFAITVHALKSNSKMIGAMELSSMFETLELAAKDNDEGAVKALLEDTVTEYERLLGLIRPFGEMDSFMASDEISAKEAVETADALLEALDDFDDELSATLVKKLAGYPFRITQKEKLNEATEYISQFMYDEAAGLIREIYPEIE